MAAITLKTAEDLYQLPDEWFGELIDGVLIKEPPPGWVHQLLVARIIDLLSELEHRGLGLAIGAPGIILRRNPDTVRAPDAAFLRRNRLPAEGFPAGYSDLVPDVIVEIQSPSTTPAELQARIHDWLEAGARLVLVVYPEDQTLEVIRSLQDRRRLTSSETLDANDVLPGFVFHVGRIFGPSL